MVFAMDLGRYFKLFISLSFAFIVLAGCKKIPEGHFEGNLIRKQNTHTSHEPVSIDIVRLAKGKRLVFIKNSQGNIIQEIELKKVKDTELELSIPILQNDPIPLTKSKSISSHPEENEKLCFSSQSQWKISLCFQGSLFLLTVENALKDEEYVLSGSQFSTFTSPELETPTFFSISEAIERALNSNFNIRISGEDLFQARQNVYTAYSNLVPRFGINLLWYTNPTPVTAVTGLLTGLPFLLPTQWSSAKKSNVQYELQKQALMTLKADLITSIEVLGTLVLRDQTILHTLNTHLEKAENLRSQLEAENTNTQTSSSQLKTELETYIESLKESILKAETSLKRSRYEASLALGFRNPNAVLGFSDSFELEHSENEQTHLEPETIMSVAIRRSYELEQFNLLSKMEDLNNIQLAFNWLCPYGDPQMLLGLNLIFQYKLLRSRKEKIEIEKEKAEAMLRKTALEAVLANLEARRAYAVVVKKLNNIDQSFHNIHAPFLINSLKDSLAFSIEKLNRIAEVKMTQSKIDRLLLDSNFFKLLPRL